MTLEERIALGLLKAEQNGELRAAPSWGRPLDLDDAFARTPEELRMAYKALKEAGFVPPELETMQQIRALRREIEACADSPDAEVLRRRLAELRQHLALRLEKLRRSVTSRRG